MKNRRISVLFVGRDERDFSAVRSLLRSTKEVTAKLQWIAEFALGLEMALTNKFDVCLIDYCLDKHNGLDFIRKALRSGCTAPLILLSGKRDYALDMKAMESGASDYLVKSELESAFLKHSMQYAIARKKEELALRHSKRLQQEANEKMKKNMLSINEELDMAGKVQESMLPRDVTEINGLTVATAYLPCGRIGGDLYDIIKIDETRSCFIMFDVVGHGVPAALISAMAKVSFTKNVNRVANTAEIMERVNKEIVSFFKEKRHITAFIAVYDSACREIVFTGGGHPSPIVLHPKERRIEYLVSRGLPLGMFGDVQYEVSRTRLCPEDCIVFFTDGLVESSNSNDALFGKKRLEAILTNLPVESSANDILGAIIKAQCCFSGNNARSDDITIVIVKIP
jgi:serine phosphatase RsbU (regulator of sigma subunit)